MRTTLALILFLAAMLRTWEPADNFVGVHGMIFRMAGPDELDIPKRRAYAR